MCVYVQHLDGSLAGSPVHVLEARQAVQQEAWWLEFGWWEGHGRCQEAVEAANRALLLVLARLE